MSAAATLPELLWRNAGRWPSRPAWQHKRRGIWQTITWSAFAAWTGDIAFGLAAEGFGPGERLAVQGDNRPELYAALLAAQSLGGVGVPLDPEADPEWVGAILRTCGATVLVVDTAGLAGRVRPALAALPGRVRVICVDPGRLHAPETTSPSSLAAIAAAGRAIAANRTEPLADAFVPGAAESQALLLYPPSAPAAAAVPPAVVLTHARLLAAATAIAASDALGPMDAMLSYLPMASADDMIHSLALGLVSGLCCNCPEAPDSVLRDLREIGPTVFHATPAACTALAEIVATKEAAASPFKRLVFAAFERLALRAEALRDQGRPIPLGLALGCRIGEWVVFAPARDQLGLGRVRAMHSGLPVPGEAERRLRALGVALRPAVSIDLVEPAIPRRGEALHA